MTPTALSRQTPRLKKVAPLSRARGLHQPIEGFSNFSQLGGYGVQAHEFPFQTTEHGPALARRSQWVSVPGAPLRATFSDACAGPLARVGLDSFPAPPAVGATLYRGARLALADRHSRDVALKLSVPHTAFVSVPLEADDNSKRTLGFIYPPGLIAQGPFFFARLVRGCNRSPSQLAETFESQFNNSVVVNQSHTRSPQWSFVRSAVFCRNT